MHATGAKTRAIIEKCRLGPCPLSRSIEPYASAMRCSEIGHTFLQILVRLRVLENLPTQNQSKLLHVAKKRTDTDKDRHSKAAQLAAQGFQSFRRFNSQNLVQTPGYDGKAPVAFRYGGMLYGTAAASGEKPQKCCGECANWTRM